MNKLVVMLPAYNEEENLETLINAWRKHKTQLQNAWSTSLHFVVVNDGSKDKTQEIGERLAAGSNDFTLVNHEVNKGLGEAMKTGISYVLDQVHDCSFVCVMDCDNTHDPETVFDMLTKHQETGAECIIASRYQKGAEIQGVSKLRLLTSEGARFVFSGLLRVKNVRDYTCGYRLYAIDALRRARKRFGTTIIEESGFTCMAELLYKLHASGTKFAEVPFHLRYDLKQGQSKMKVLKTALNSFKLALRLKSLK